MTTAPTHQVTELLQELAGDPTQGPQQGLQVAAYHHGQLVIDAWAGSADPASGRPVAGDTLFAVYSAGKAIVSTCIHVLVEQGLIDYDTPIAASWPAFTANGKAGITVGHVLTHRSGVPQLPPGTTAETMCDWDAMCVGIAALKPLWEPGTTRGYHAGTFGWILGEVLHRVDGRAFSQFVQDEICRPLGLEGELYFGLPEGELSRAATADLGPPGEPPEPDSLAEQTFPIALRRIFNRSDVRRACIPAFGGLMSARGLAAHYASLIGSGVGGVRLLPATRVTTATVPLPDEPDVVWGIRSAQGLGYLLGGPLPDGSDYDVGGRRSAFGHPGIGGPIGFADPDYGLAVAINMTTPRGDGGTMRRRIAEQIRAVLGVPQQPIPSAV